MGSPGQSREVVLSGEGREKIYRAESRNRDRRSMREEEGLTERIFQEQNV